MKKILVFTALTSVLGLAALPVLAQDSAPPPPASAEEAGDQPQDDGMWWLHGKGQGRHHHGKGEMGRMGHMERMGQMGASIDANNDNVIGDSEAAALANRGFMRLDRDGSGDIDEAEFTTPRKRGGWWSWTATQKDGIEQGLKAKFVALDADKSGKVSKQEYMTDAQSRFAATDTNRDGKVSPWEFYAKF